MPLLDNVFIARQRLTQPKPPAIYSLAGDLGVNDPDLRQRLHEQGILTVSIPKTIEPIPPKPTPEEILSTRNEADLNRKRTPHQVQVACVCGYSRAVVKSHIASLLARDTGGIRYKGAQGAVVQQGTTVMAHNGATVMRIRQQRLSKHGQRFRRLLVLRCPSSNQINDPKIIDY